MASGVWRTSEARLLSDAPGVDPAPGVQPPVDKHALYMSFLDHIPAILRIALAFILILAISSVWYNIPFYGCSAANRHFEPKAFRYVLHGDVDPYFQGHP
jgi:hypothetical protein